MFIFPSGVRITPGTSGKAARNFCSTRGNVRSCPELIVAGGAVVSKETAGAFSFTSTFWRTIILAGQDDLDEWRLSFGDSDILLNQRLISERCASQIIATRDQPREFKAAPFPGCSGSPFFGQAGTDECAGCPCYRSVFVSQHLALKGLSWRYRSAKAKRKLQQG